MTDWLEAGRVVLGLIIAFVFLRWVAIRLGGNDNDKDI